MSRRGPLSLSPAAHLYPRSAPYITRQTRLTHPQCVRTNGRVHSCAPHLRPVAAYPRRHEQHNAAAAWPSQGMNQKKHGTTADVSAPRPSLWLYQGRPLVDVHPSLKCVCTLAFASIAADHTRLSVQVPLLLLSHSRVGLTWTRAVCAKGARPPVHNREPGSCNCAESLSIWP